MRFLNPQNEDSQRKNSDKAFIQNLEYNGIKFPVTIKQITKIDININVLGYEEKQEYPIYVSKEKYKDHMNLLLIIENEKNKFMYNQTKHKERKHFCMYCLQCFSSEKVLTNHKDICLQINGLKCL